MQAERKIRPQDIVPEETAFLRLGDRQLQTADRQRILRAHVDIAFLRAYRVRRDHHALDHLVGIPLHDAPVHKCSRIALIAVADYVAFLLLLARYLGPFVPGREAAAPAPAQVRV